MDEVTLQDSTLLAWGIDTVRVLTTSYLKWWQKGKEEWKGETEIRQKGEENGDKEKKR